MRSVLIHIGQHRLPIIFINVQPGLNQPGGLFFCSTVFHSYFNNRNTVLPSPNSNNPSVLTVAYSRAAVDAMASAYLEKWSLDKLAPSVTPCSDAQVAGHQGRSDTIYLPRPVFERVLDAFVSSTFTTRGTSEKPANCDLPGLLAAQEQLGAFFRSLSGMSWRN